MKEKVIINSICIITMFLLIGILISIIALDSKTSSNVNQQQEKPVLYWKNIDVEVVSSRRKSNLFGRVKRYSQTITVRSKEYKLEKTFKLNSSGAFANMPYWNIKEGDIIKAELYSWKLESTGEIVRREINKLK